MELCYTWVLAGHGRQACKLSLLAVLGTQTRDCEATAVIRSTQVNPFSMGIRPHFRLGVQTVIRCSMFPKFVWDANLVLSLTNIGFKV